MKSFNKGPIWPSPAPKHHNEVLMATLELRVSDLHVSELAPE